MNISSPRAASRLRALWRHLWRGHEDHIRAIGGKTLALAAAAAFLLLLGFGAAVATVVSLSHSAKPDGRVAAQMAELLDDVERASMALLRTVGTIHGQVHQVALVAAWEKASGNIRRLCAEAGPVKPPRSQCERLVHWRLLLDRDLLPGARLAPSDLDRATTNLLDLAAFLAQYEEANREHSSANRALVDEQRSLLLLLLLGTGGALAASFVLFHVVTRSAASTRRRWLASVEAERAAVEARQQLMEAVEVIPVGFGLYGRDGRMVMFNSRLADVNPVVYKPDIIGLHYEEIVERLVNWRPRSQGDREDVRDMLLARFRGQCDGNMQVMADGRFLESYEVHTPGGFVATVRVDVTSLKRREKELEASEARYRNLVDSLMDAVFISDGQRVSYASAAAQRVLGRPAEELIGLTAASLFRPEDIASMIEAMRAARATPDAIQTLRVRSGGVLPAGRHMELRFTTSGPADEQGRFGFIGIVRDITVETQMEQKRHEDMMKLRSIMESSGASIALVDDDGRLSLANRTFLESVGQTLAEVVGRKYDEVVGCDEADLAAWRDGDVADRLRPLAFDRVFTAADGSRRVMRVTASRVRDEAGRANYTLFLGVDETERRTAEIRAIDAGRLSTLGEMATGIAHEINQPLTVIQFAADSLQAEIEDAVHESDPEGFGADALHRIERLKNQAQRAASIVRRLQGFARKGEDVAAPFDVAEAIRGAVDLVSEQMRLARIAVDLDLSAGLPPVHGFANRLQQILINLMINARDAIEEARAGDRTRQDRIGIGAADANGLLVIEVADSGPGIPPSVLPRLFESFFTTKPKGKGTGLGLSISLEIMREMNGSMTAENLPGGGAVFRLSIPSAAAGLATAA